MRVCDQACSHVFVSFSHVTNVLFVQASKKSMFHINKFYFVFSFIQNKITDKRERKDEH